MKFTLQGLEVEDLALLLHGIRSIDVVDMRKRRAKLEKKLEGALETFGVCSVIATNVPHPLDVARNPYLEPHERHERNDKAK